MLRTRLTLALAGLLTWALPLGAQTVSDPFLPGMRWSEGSALSQPWIPRRVRFAGAGQGIWAGRAVGTPGATLFVGSDAISQSAALDLPLTGALGAVELAVGAQLDELYTAAQYPGTGTGRVTEVSRSSALGSGSAPLWTRVLAPEVAGGALLATGGKVLLCARFDPAAGVVWLDRMDPADGASRFAIQTPATALRGLAVSESGSRIALALGDSLGVFDASGALLASLALPINTEAFDLSADGTTLVAGDKGQLHIWRDSGAGFVPAGSVLQGGDWLATRASLSADGWTLGVGWWDSKQGISIRFQMWDLAGATKLHDVLQSGVPGGLQNFPEAVVVSADGQRMAAGAWGSGGPDPQLMLLDRDDPQPVFSAYLPGSAMALDLDPSGTRIAVAAKAGHANQFSTTGFVELFDTGERDLQSVGAVQTGLAFQLTSRLPGSAASLFLIGSPLAAQVPWPGVLGQLALDPLQPLGLFVAPADPSGRADLFGLVPADPTLVGLEVAVQAVFAGALGPAFSVEAPRLSVL